MKHSIEYWPVNPCARCGGKALTSIIGGTTTMIFSISCCNCNHTMQAEAYKQICCNGISFYQATNIIARLTDKWNKEFDDKMKEKGIIF